MNTRTPRPPLPRLHARRDGPRPEHDDAQLRAHPGARPRAAAGDEVVGPGSTTTRTWRPGCELAHDRDLTSSRRGRRRRPRSTSPTSSASSASARARGVPARLERRRAPRRRAPVAELAHAAGALAWVDAVHYAPHGPIDVAALGVDVLVCSPYKFFGPHLGLAFGRRELLERWRPYKVRPAPTSRSDAASRPARCARAARGIRAAVEYVETSAGTRSACTSAPRRALPRGSPTSGRRCTACRRWTAASRRSRSRTTRSSADAVAHAWPSGVAVW